MTRISPDISIDDDELDFTFIRSPGPGGQNVNKVSSAVQLKFNVKGSPSLSEQVKQRLVRLAGKRVTEEGYLIIEAHQYRTQERNRQMAIERLVRLLLQADQPPKTRYKTRPSHASIQRRLETKRRRSEIKHMRRNRPIVE